MCDFSHRSSHSTPLTAAIALAGPPGLDPEYSDLPIWLLRCVGAIRRALPPPPTANQPGCEVLQVGFNWGSNVKNVELKDPDVVCPTRVNRGNWLGEDPYDDSFKIVQDGTKVAVSRESEFGVEMDHGWGMNLHFLCCVQQVTEPPVNETEDVGVGEGGEDSGGVPDRLRWVSVDHYVVMGVPCDFTPAMLRQAYRKLSLKLHPDRGEVRCGAFNAAADSRRSFQHREPQQAAPSQRNHTHHPSPSRRQPCCVRACGVSARVSAG